MSDKLLNLKKIFLLLISIAYRLALLGQPATHTQSPAPDRPYWQQEVSYTINVSLNDIEHSLDGLAKIKYTNNSPDTLFFVWFHCWPNAYKNDQTAFSEQLLGNDRTDFYFSEKQQRGYINRLNFRVDGTTARMEDHPQYIDIIKLQLPAPLPPGRQTEIAVSFHEQLPNNFSRGGHTGQFYQLTQWYPKPAVYDRQGWHPLPYLDQGGAYDEYGDYDVTIHVPANYAVAATGELLEGDAAATPPPVSTRAQPARTKSAVTKPAAGGASSRSQPHKPPILATIFFPKKSIPHHIPSDTLIKTLHFRQQEVSDFAWFAGKNLTRDQDTLQLNSGKIVRINAYYNPANAPLWKNSIRDIKDALRFRSASIGEYPFNTLTAVEWNSETRSGMSYPSLIAIATPSPERPFKSGGFPTKNLPRSFPRTKELDLRIEHQIGFNWFGEALGSDNRSNPWMSEGMNAYYDLRYEKAKYSSPKISAHSEPSVHSSPSAHSEPSSPELDKIFADTWIEQRMDQPISGTSADFTALNYKLMAGTKAANWMRQLEDTLGTALFDSSMREYYRRWQFHHPSPQDFHTVLENTGGRNPDDAFRRLDEKGPLTAYTPLKKIRPAFLFSTRNTDKIEYVNIGPAVGYNEYDKLMVGALIHNFNLPPTPFQFLLAPLYATNSKQLNGLGRLSYSVYPGNPGAARNRLAGHGAPIDDAHHTIQSIEFAVDGARFSSLSATDSNGNKIFGGFYKIVPSIRLTLKKSTPRSTVEKWIGFKTYLIGEKGFDRYVMKSTDSLYYPVNGSYGFRYLNQLSLNLADDRILYPYNAQLQFQQAARFYRINFTGNYFFNYSSGGGMAVRVFAAKFGYLGGKSSAIDLSAFEPKLTGVRGNEDYTYDNYFLGRNEFTGFANQQVMIRDGGLKIQAPQFPYLEGRSDNWVAATNLNTTLPAHLFPFPVPIKIFLDIGTYAGGWQSNPVTSKFLYVGGLQLSLLHNIINFYAPIFYSSDFGDQLKTIPEGNTFLKKISFSIDLQNIDLKKIGAKAMAAKTLY